MQLHVYTCCGYCRNYLLSLASRNGGSALRYDDVILFFCRDLDIMYVAYFPNATVGCY